MGDFKSPNPVVIITFFVVCIGFTSGVATAPSKDFVSESNEQNEVNDIDTSTDNTNELFGETTKPTPHIQNKRNVAYWAKTMTDRMNGQEPDYDKRNAAYWARSMSDRMNGQEPEYNKRNAAYWARSMSDGMNGQEPEYDKRNAAYWARTMSDRMNGQEPEYDKRNAAYWARTLSDQMNGEEPQYDKRNAAYWARTMSDQMNGQEPDYEKRNAAYWARTMSDQMNGQEPQYDKRNAAYWARTMSDRLNGQEPGFDKRNVAYWARSMTDRMNDDGPLEFGTNKRNMAYVAKMRSLYPDQYNHDKRNVAHLARFRSQGLIDNPQYKRNMAYMARLRSQFADEDKSKRNVASFARWKTQQMFGNNNPDMFENTMQKRDYDLFEYLPNNDYYDTDTDAEENQAVEKRHFSSLLGEMDKRHMSSLLSKGKRFFGSLLDDETPFYKGVDNGKRSLSSLLGSNYVPNYIRSSNKRHFSSLLSTTDGSRRFTRDATLENDRSKRSADVEADDSSSDAIITNPSKKYFGSLLKSNNIPFSIYRGKYNLRKRSITPGNAEEQKSDKRNLASLLKGKNIPNFIANSKRKKREWMSVPSSMFKNERLHIPFRKEDNYPTYDKRHFGSMLNSDQPFFAGYDKRYLAALLNSDGSVTNSQQKRYYASLLRPDNSNENYKRFYGSLLNSDTPYSDSMDKRFYGSVLNDAPFFESNKRHLSSLFRPDYTYDKRFNEPVFNSEDFSPEQYENLVDPEKKSIQSIVSAKSKRDSTTAEDKQTNQIGSTGNDYYSSELNKDTDESMKESDDSNDSNVERDKRYIGTIARNNEWRSSWAGHKQQHRRNAPAAEYDDYMKSIIEEQLQKALLEARVPNQDINDVENIPEYTSNDLEQSDVNDYPKRFLGAVARDSMFPRNYRSDGEDRTSFIPSSYSYNHPMLVRGIFN